MQFNYQLPAGDYQKANLIERERELFPAFGVKDNCEKKKIYEQEKLKRGNFYVTIFYSLYLYLVL